MHPDERVTVIGAGVAGLTTAVILAEAGQPVRVVADEIPGRTSLAAGAMWGPYLVEPKALVDTWSQRSLELFRELASDAATGVGVSSGIEASRHHEEAPDWARSLPGFEAVGADLLPNGFRSGYRFSVPLIDMPTYLHYLLERARAAGVAIDKRRVPTLTSITDAEVIVNCSGLGASTLAGDTALYPIRGQHVVVANPGLTEFFSEDTGTSSDLLCIYPQGDVVVLGGTAIDGSSDTAPDPVAADRILERCIAVEPRLASAAVIEHRIGLRPTRPQVRVEAEQLNGAVVIHNYGHGGAGVTLSWGCAEQVQQLLGKSASG
ncbi:FAD-dependent oxidoreductase [Nocardioides sp. NPDC059952]|uniref:FAD-dependent oxidoreductase n=1 Tax=Nocardioides sp. NPDC059952 TaxID=3347014 RepID=UPI003663F463